MSFPITKHKEKSDNVGKILISQMIKGCKEKFFINQIFNKNIRRLHQGKKFFGKKKKMLQKKKKKKKKKKKTSPCSLLSFDLSTWFQGF